MHPGCAAQFTFLTSLDDVLELIRAVGDEQVKMVFDTYHLGHDESILERISEIAQHVALVQLGDSRRPPDGEQNRCFLGEGTIPLKEIVQRLKTAGYEGFYDVELLGEEIETFDYESLIDHAKNAFQQLVASEKECA
jgi:sugar phosphate isomerase/epimerase